MRGQCRQTNLPFSRGAGRANLLQLQAVALPEGLQRRLGAVENVALQGAIDIAEVARKAIRAGVVNLGLRPAALPIHAGVLPQRPVGHRRRIDPPTRADCQERETANRRRCRSLSRVDSHVIIIFFVVMAQLQSHRPSAIYQIGMALVMVAMLILPAVYLALTLLAAFDVYYFAAHYFTAIWSWHIGFSKLAFLLKVICSFTPLFVGERSRPLHDQAAFRPTRAPNAAVGSRPSGGTSGLPAGSRGMLGRGGTLATQDRARLRTECLSALRSRPARFLRESSNIDIRHAVNCRPLAARTGRGGSP